MAIVDDRVKLARGFAAAMGIRSQAQSLLALTGTVSFEQIMRPVDQIVLATNSAIVPLIAFGSAAVNAAVARQFPIGAPGDTFAALTALQSAVSSFLTPYKAIYDGAGNLITFSVSAGHQYAGVNTASLASLASPLGSIATAAAALIIDA